MGQAWEKVEFDSSMETVGPCVPLLWKDDDIISFVPTSACRLKESSKNRWPNLKSNRKATLADISTREVADNIHTPMDAMIASLILDGKKLQGDSPTLVGLENEEDASTSWEAWDAEDKKWYDVHLMNNMEPSIMPLKVLAYHICYRESDSLSIRFYTFVGTKQLFALDTNE